MFLSIDMVVDLGPPNLSEKFYWGGGEIEYAAL
jgi:hypothetical protein